MTYQTYNYSDLIAIKLKTLPVDKQKQVLDFVDFLAQRAISEQQNIKEPSGNSHAFQGIGMKARR